MVKAQGQGIKTSICTTKTGRMQNLLHQAWHHDGIGCNELSFTTDIDICPLIVDMYQAAIPHIYDAKYYKRLPAQKS